MSDPDVKYYEGIGLMSGTSMDGIDLAFCRFIEQPASEPSPRNNIVPWSYEILKASTIPLPSDLKNGLRTLDKQSAMVFAQTDVEFGHFLGESICTFIQRNNIIPQFIANHGQTIFHQPENKFTTQIGDGETIASYLKVPLVTQFRNKDVALGGQGAPLVPFGEKQLFPKDQMFLNLGGIANLTCGDLAFDVCVCNMALNWLAQQLSPVQEFDPNGACAASGKVIPALLESLEKLSWYQLPPPKSLGKEWFDANIAPILVNTDTSVENQLSTYSEHISNQITKALSAYSATHPPTHTQLLISGGGTHNSHLMGRIQQKITNAHLPIKVLSDPLLTDYKEAMIFAFLGLQTLLGKPNILSSITGSSQSSIGGSIHLPATIESFQLPLTPRAPAF